MAGVAITTPLPSAFHTTPTRPSPPHHRHAVVLPLHPSSLHISKSTTLCFSSSLSSPATTTTTTTKNAEILEDPVEMDISKRQKHPKTQPLLIHWENHECFSHFLRLAALHWDLRLGRALHAAIVKTQGGGGGGEDVIVTNKLMSMYLKLGRTSDAKKVFEEMTCPDVASYTSLISAYAKSGREVDAMGLFFQMQDSGIEFNEFTVVAVLTSCLRHLNSQLGLQIHSLAIKTCYHLDVYVSNVLLGLYVKLGRVYDALRLFNEMAERNVSSWNAIILGMVKESRYDEAFELFFEMRMSGIYGDQFTLSSLLTAAKEGFFRFEGEGLHAHGIKIGLELDASLCNALIAFYTEFGCLQDVVNIFNRLPTKDVISLTAMISGYMEFGLVEAAVKVFNEMPEVTCISYNALMAGFCHNGKGFLALELFQKIVECGMELSDFTLASAVRACALVSEVRKCEQVHGFVIKVGCGFNCQVEAALLDMYVKCNRMEDAQKIFNKWIDKESLLIASTILICGYARNGYYIEALYSFHELITKGDVASLDEVLISTILGVCGVLGFVEVGKQMHCHTLKCRYSLNVTIGNSLISLYSKCGNMGDAMKIFNSMPVHDVVSWNTLITAHLMHWQGDEALGVWKKMNMHSFKPDGISFLLILSACKYTSFNSVDISRSLFSSMVSSFSVTPCEEHYASMVAVLCHWNCFHEAEQLIKDMPCEPGALVWRALLDGCRLNSNLGLVKHAVQNILQSKPVDPSTYVLVSNLYAASGRWHCSEKTREEMREKGVHKHPSKSWIIHQNMIHSFHTRDKTHPQSKDIYSALNLLILECMKVGYIPDTSFVLQEVEEFQKKGFLFYHSAKLAATYGHLITTARRPIRVMKNVILCGDCHSFLKFLSVVTAREITFRDSNGFHRFEGGECSCRDGW